MVETEILTRTARHTIDEHGIIHITPFPGTTETLADAQASVRANAKLSNGKRAPFLVDVSGVRSVDREARLYYTSEEAAKVSSACALLVNSPTSRLIGNFFIGMNRSMHVPTKLFTSKAEAIMWLKGFIE